MADKILDELREARDEVDRAEDEVARLVSTARQLGYSWERIGQALGVTRPAAWERYHDRTDE
jgi:hypothetical protein